ncbi:MAG: hypothetical protein ABI647_05250 [Gemmatimonadota bacterium]
MTGPTPARQTDIGSQGRSPAAPDAALADPWGVRRAENLLTSLEGILSARVVTTPLGDVTEVHVLAQAGIPAKQLVRNIESALLAHLGLKIDHRKISIAQTADVKPIEALDKGAVRERAMQRAILFEDLVVNAGQRTQRVVMSVTLSSGPRREVAEVEVADTARARLEGAARATLVALEKFVERHSFALDEVRIVDAVDKKVVFAAVQGIGGRDAALLTGTAEVRLSAERAAILAVLDATNRWAEARRP